MHTHKHTQAHTHSRTHLLLHGSGVFGDEVHVIWLVSGGGGPVYGMWGVGRVEVVCEKWKWCVEAERKLKSSV